MRNIILILSTVAVLMLALLIFKMTGDDTPTETTGGEQVEAGAKPLEGEDDKVEIQNAVSKTSQQGQARPSDAAAKKQPTLNPAATLWANAQQAEQSGKAEQIARAYGSFLEALSQTNDPWATESRRIETAKSKINTAMYDFLFSSTGTWKAISYTVAGGDSLYKVRKKIMNSGGKPLTVGFIRMANRLQNDTIHPGQKLRIPQGEFTAVIDRKSYSMRLYLDDLLIGFYRVGLGKGDMPTPTGAFVVGEKQNNPTWFPRGKAPIGPDDPANPLGSRWLALLRDGQKTGYGIHGTNDDAAVGTSISQGCIRMYNNQVVELGGLLPVGAKVEIH